MHKQHKIFIVRLSFSSSELAFQYLPFLSAQGYCIPETYMFHTLKYALWQLRYDLEVCTY